MKKTLLWRAVFLAASLSSVMSVGASPFEGQESSRRNSSSHTGAGDKRKATSLGEDSKIPKKTRGDDQCTQEESSQAPMAIAGEVIQDPSLGHLSMLPPEILEIVFSYLPKPFVMREVSTATKAIVENHLALQVSKSCVDNFSRQYEVDPLFFKNVKIALDGWTDNPEELCASFPLGTVFKGGDLRFYGNVPSSLPQSFWGTVVVETNKEKRDFLTSNVRPNLGVLSLEEKWTEFLESAFWHTLSPLKRDAILLHKSSFEFLLGLADGQDTLMMLIDKCFEGDGGLSGKSMIDHLAHNFFWVFERLGTTKQKLDVMGAMLPKVLDKDVERGAMQHALETVATYQDQNARLWIASKIQPYMMRLDDPFYDYLNEDGTYFQETLWISAYGLIKSDNKLIEKINIKHLFTKGVPQTYFGALVMCLEKLNDLERAKQLAPLITSSFINAFVKDTPIPNGTYRLFMEGEFDKALQGLACLKTKKARQSVISLAGVNNMMNEGAYAALFEEMDKNPSFFDLIHRLKLGAQAKMCVRPGVMLSVLKGLAKLKNEKLASQLTSTFHSYFIYAFQWKNGASAEHPLACFADLEGAVTELGRVEPALRSRVSSLITKEFLNRLYVGEGDEEKGALAVRVAKALLMVEDQTTRNHLCSALTPSFFKALASHEGHNPQILNRAISALARIQSPEIRARAITLLGDQGDAQMQGPISAIDFLEMLASKANEDLQNTYLFLYE